jgi:hypothetical protein
MFAALASRVHFGTSRLEEDVGAAAIYIESQST